MMGEVIGQCKFMTPLGVQVDRIGEEPVVTGPPPAGAVDVG